MRMRVALVFLLVVVSWTASAQGPSGGRADADRRGWEAIRAGRNQDAATAFTQALEAQPRDPMLHLGAGLTAASLLLGDILYRDSDIDGAIRIYEAALPHAPADRTLASRLATLRRETDLHRDFFQSQGSHFTVLFEGPADEVVARRAIEVLEEAYYRIGTALYTFPERPITVVLYTAQQFQDVTRSPAWAAAAYDGRIRVPMRGALDRDEELQRVLAHEFTHALVQTIAPRGVPTWLNEGLAVMFEPAGVEWTERTLGQSSERLPLTRLADGFARFSPAEARLAYAESAAAVRVMLDQAGSATVVALLQDIAAGRPLADAFAARMLIPYDQFVAAGARAH